MSGILGRLELWAPSELAKLRIVTRQVELPASLAAATPPRFRIKVSGRFDDGWHPREAAVAHLTVVAGLLMEAKHWRPVGEPISRQLDHIPDAWRPNTRWELTYDAEPVGGNP